MTKFLFRFFFVVLITPVSFASNLCSSNCDLTITFPTGGSFEAIEPVTFTFGSGGRVEPGNHGTINTATQPATIDFSSGGSLTLAAGESISFDNDGVISLGTDGNLNYSNIRITSEGNIDLIATGDSKTIHLYTIAGVNLTEFNVTGEYIFSYSSLIFSDADLTFTATENIQFTTDSLTLTESVVSTNLNLEATNTISFSPAAGVNVSNAVLIDTTFYVSPVYILPPPSELTIIPTPLEINGEPCSLIPGEEVKCETESGKVYKFVDGEWIPVEGSGFIQPISIIMVIASMLFRRRYF